MNSVISQSLKHIEGLLRSTGKSAREQKSKKPISKPSVSVVLKAAEYLSKIREICVSAIIIMMIAVLVWFLVFETKDNQIVIVPIAIPKIMRDIGYNEEIATLRLYDALQKLNKRRDRSREESQILPASQELDIAVPGTGISLKSIAQIVRRLLNRPQTLIVGEFVCQSQECGLGDVNFSFRVAGGRSGLRSLPKIGSINLEEYFEKISEQVMLEANPYNLAAIYFNTGRRQESRTLADSILLELPKEKEWIENLIGSDEFIKGNVEESVIWFKKSIETNPNFAPPHWQLGYILLTHDTQKDVMSEVRRNRGKTKFEILAYLEFGASRVISRNQEDGDSHFLKAISIDKSGEFALSAWANALTFLGRNKEALIKLELAAKEHPNSYLIYSRWGNSFHWLVLANMFGDGDEKLVLNYYEQGIEKYKVAISIDPTQPFAYVGLGLLTFIGESQEKAMALYEKAISIDPSFVDAYKALSSALGWRGNFKEAVEKLTIANKYSPSRLMKVDEQFASIYTAWGESLVLDGDDVLALSKFVEAAKIYPSSREAYGGWAGVLRRQGRFDEAIVQYEKMSKVGAPSSEAYRNLAEVYMEQNKYADAVRRLRTAQGEEYMLRSDLPNILATVHVGWGDNLSKSGDSEAAIVQFKTALEADPRFFLSYVRWGEALGRAGDQEGKIERCQAAIKTESSFDEAHMCLAQAFEATNKFGEAISAFQRYLELAPFETSQAGHARHSLMRLRAGELKRPL
jgi:tetratricopeptide (TPR) repeat protein